MEGNTMEDFFANLRKTVTGTVDAVSKKTEEVVEIQKLKNKANTAENKRNQNYKKIGEIIAQRYNSGEAFDETIAELCDEINALLKEEEGLKKEISLKTGKIICPTCHYSNPKDAAFCMSCGSKLEKEDVVSEADFVDEDLEDLPPYEEELEEYPEENSEGL